MQKVYCENGEYKRIFEVDLIRGFCMVLVLFDHLMFQFACCFVETPFFIKMQAIGYQYWNWGLRKGVQFAVVGIFFLISGVSSSLSKNNTMRGLKIVAVACVLTVATQIASRVSGIADIVIDFGVIHAFGFSILLYAMIKDCKEWVVLLFACVIFFLAWYIPTLGIETTSKVLLPFGVKPIGYVYGDYYPLFPWAGFLLLGGVIGKLLYPTRKSLVKNAKPKIIKPILHIGRNSLFYYFGEVVVLIACFYLIDMIL